MSASHEEIDTPTSTASSTASSTATLSFDDPAQMLLAIGTEDSNLAILQGQFPGLNIAVRGLDIQLSGHEQARTQAMTVLLQLRQMAQAGVAADPQQLRRMISAQADPAGQTSVSALTKSILTSRSRTIRAKTHNQSEYVDAIDENTVVFGIGPAGTGKTYLAMAKAVQALNAKEVNRIILTRPAVEAGERLGFLPGNLNEKIDPYLRPLFDALHDMLDPDSIPRLMEAGTIEVAPLAYMRGRTLNDAFIILDEAQNTTAEQMKMFLTRLGFGSTMVVTGDVTQVDLPRGAQSGLRVVENILSGIEDVAFVHLGSEDVVRHQLVSEIVNAYERHSAVEH